MLKEPFLLLYNLFYNTIKKQKYISNQLVYILSNLSLPFCGKVSHINEFPLIWVAFVFRHVSKIIMTVANFFCVSSMIYKDIHKALTYSTKTGKFT